MKRKTFCHLIDLKKKESGADSTTDKKPAKLLTRILKYSPHGLETEMRWLMHGNNLFNAPNSELPMNVGNSLRQD